MPSTSFHVMKSLHNSLIINVTRYIYFNVHNQAIIQSTEYRINYGAKFNFIDIKKINGVPKFFFEE